MSTSQRVLAYAGVIGLLGFGMGLWAAGAHSTALATDAAPARADSVKIAAFDVLDVAEKMFLGERYAPAREAALKEKQGQRDALQTGLNELQQRIVAAGQDTPEGKLMIPNYQARVQELQQFEQTANNDLNALSTSQFSECYRLATETAQSIARQQGYTHLFASKMGPLEFRSKELQAALQEVLARPLLMTATGDDLTALVKKELKIEDPPAEKAGDNGEAPAKK